MNMIPNTGFVILSNLEIAFDKATAMYDQFDKLYVRMANTRGGINPKMEMDVSHRTRCVSYLKHRLTVERTIPEFRGLVEDLLAYTARIREMFESDEDEKQMQMLKISYLQALAFIYQANELIAKAEDHIERSAAVNPEIRDSLQELINRCDDPEVLTKFAHLQR